MIDITIIYLYSSILQTEKDEEASKANWFLLTNELQAGKIERVKKLFSTKKGRERLNSFTVKVTVQ